MIFCPGYFLFFLAIFGGAMSEIIDVPEYWPELANDLTKVVWSHATNSQEKLKKALEGDTMMIEADVNLGIYTEDTSIELIPIMAHPPIMFSDLSLESFLNTIIDAINEDTSLKKGIKLDFKRTDILPKSLEIVQNLLERVNFPLWINADIIQGPSFLGLPKLGMVDGNQFLNLTKQYVPNATLSPGFTTSGTAHPPEYTIEQMDNMITALSDNGDLMNGYRVTFPIRAIYAARSKEVIQYLLDQTSTHQLNSTLTIWGTDNISQEEIEALKAFIVSIGKHRVYVDTAYDLDPLENQIEDRTNEENTENINNSVLTQIQQFFYTFFNDI